MREEPLSKFTGTAYWSAPYKGPIFRFGRLLESLESATRTGSQGHEWEDAAPELAPVLEGDKCMKLDR